MKGFDLLIELCDKFIAAQILRADNFKVNSLSYITSHTNIQARQHLDKQTCQRYCIYSCKIYFPQRNFVACLVSFYTRNLDLLTGITVVAQ